ncbi:MAG: ABC transporter permease [Deltaproteobacteria bacterium]|nr:ABC transporter permease [Deltaproteobacteria bacterium]
MKWLVICRRELSATFGSLVAYILLAVFLVLSGYFFYSDLIFFILFGGFTLSTGLWQFVFLDMRLVAMLILPLVTMRLFAEEKKLGTLELLWTYPVRDGEIVLGKFLAAWLFYVVMLAATAAGPLMFYHYQPFDVLPVLAGYLGILLLGSAFIACGLFVSSLTENQVVSAMVTYGILVLFWFLTWNEEAATHAVMRWLLGLSLFDRFFNFTRGVIDTKDVTFFALFVAFFLFLTWQSLATRSWRGVR